MEFFDIGNHLELAERLRAAPATDASLSAKFDTESNAAVYRAANAVEKAPAPAPQPFEPARALSAVNLEASRPQA